MKTFLCYVLLSLASASVAFAKVVETYSITFFSSSGEVLGTGAINFSTPVPAEGKARGTYVLLPQKVTHTDKHTEWFYRLIGKRDKGEIEWVSRPDQPDDWRIVLNFAPGTADANIGARISALTAGHAKGVWSYSIFAGGFEGGLLEIQRK
jgi:hypothetical protein